MLQVKPMVDEFSDAPGWIEIVGVTENRLVLVAGVNRAGDKFVMLGVVTGFDVRLRINIKVRRPVHKSDGKKIRLLLEQADLTAKNQFVRVEALEDGNLRPFC